MSDPYTTWNRLRARAGRLSTTDRPSGRRPIAAVLRCADAGLDARTVFGQPTGAFIEFSSWGPTVDTGVLAGVEFAVETAEVPLIIVLGHDDCAAMGAALSAWDHAELPGGARRSVIEGVLMSLVGRGVSAGSPAHIAAAHAVETGLALLQRSPLLTRRLDEGRCGIVCATHDAATLRVHATMGDVREDAPTLVECV
ncbi:MAG: carbonic anhydrase [Actinomycetota bacterium]|nr:carbonic anhydrase [Actinomycetota bacterium]